MIRKSHILACMPLAVSALLVPFGACHRKQIPPLPVPVVMDTMYPGSYIPAWPGSKWVYLDHAGKSFTVTTSSSFVRDVYRKSDSAYVPLYGGYPLWRYKLHQGISYYEEFSVLLDENAAVGSHWHQSGGGQSGHLIYFLRMLKKDTVVHVADTAYSHVIVLEQFIQPSPGNEVRLKRLYYAKDVGLVREEDLDSVKDSVTGHRSLQSCLINH